MAATLWPSLMPPLSTSACANRSASIAAIWWRKPWKPWRMNPPSRWATSFCVACPWRWAPAGQKIAAAKPRTKIGSALGWDQTRVHLELLRLEEERALFLHPKHGSPANSPQSCVGRPLPLHSTCKIRKTDTSTSFPPAAHEGGSGSSPQSRHHPDWSFPISAIRVNQVLLGFSDHPMSRSPDHPISAASPSLGLPSHPTSSQNGVGF